MAILNDFYTFMTCYNLWALGGFATNGPGWNAVTQAQTAVQQITQIMSQ
jgi:hypothetical protein